MIRENCKILVLLLITFFVQNTYGRIAMSQKMLTDTMKFDIRTPDNENLKFEWIGKIKFAEIVEAEKEIKVNDDKLVHFLATGRIVVKRYAFADIYMLFNDSVEYNRYLKGKNYFKLIVQFDNQRNSYSNFWLMPLSTPIFISQIDRTLTEFPPSEGYHVYLLKDGAIAYLRYRTPEFSEGNWYPSIRDFKYYYFKNYIDHSETL